jgi:hypothetical protein
MSFTKCLSETKAKQIVRLFGTYGLKFSRYNFIHYTPATDKISLQNKNSRKVTSVLMKGYELAELLYSEIDDDYESPIHVEISWNSGKDRHAMALIYFPSYKSIEFFDPSGYTHKMGSSFVPDQVMYLFLDSFHKRFRHLVEQDITFVNMTEKSINPGSHCNTWSLYYHFLRFTTKDVSTKEFKNKYMKYLVKEIHRNNTIDSVKLQKNVMGDVHNTFITKNMKNIPGLLTSKTSKLLQNANSKVISKKRSRVNMNTNQTVRRSSRLSRQS